MTIVGYHGRIIYFNPVKVFANVSIVFSLLRLFKTFSIYIRINDSRSSCPRLFWSQRFVNVLKEKILSHPTCVTGRLTRFL